MTTRRASLLLILLVAAACVRSASALGPHEVLVVANDNSIDSLYVAEAFLRLRQIPDANLVRIPIPDTVWTSQVAMTSTEFTQYVWDPANRQAVEQGVADHILAWAYSCDIPPRVNTTPPMSLTGLTFLRNRIPAPEIIKNGGAISPLFRAPTSPQHPADRAQSFDQFHKWLLDGMPVPSMLLGYTGPRGNTTEEIVEMLERGAAADGTKPQNPVYFVYNDDVRSRCRHWQFPAASNALHRLGIPVHLTTNFPQRVELTGLMAGQRHVRPAENSYVPGAFCDHLTSFAATFDKAPHTKITEWIRGGVTASAGSVTEPYANWAKFPAAYLFVFYREGCTLIESFYQSVRCPLQTLPIGDPLARPWGYHNMLRLNLKDGDTVKGIVNLTATVTGDELRDFNQIDYFVDGLPLSSERRVAWRTARWRNGRHELRAVARYRSPNRQQVFKVVRVTVAN